MKIFIIFIIFTTSLFSVTINDSLLKIHATLVPKLYLMDHAYKEKITNNSITIALLYNQTNYKNALTLKNSIDSKYANGIQSYKIKTQIVPYSKMDKTKANIYYLFPTNRVNIKKVIQKAKSTQSLTFSYLKDDLKYGVMISLNVGNRVKPILNLNAIKLYNISFRPMLLNISSIYSDKITNPLLNFNLKREDTQKRYFAYLLAVKETQNRGI